ncbi:MAG: Calx-beta domain-containing protein [Dehalococcoidia bacterium]|nr:Calx-beta domain-containing protein [Dehalococcoidia bacterium]
MIKRRAGAGLIGLLLMVALVASYGTNGVQAQSIDDVTIDGDRRSPEQATDVQLARRHCRRSRRRRRVRLGRRIDGTATGGADFTAVSDGEGTIADGATEAQIDVTLMDDTDAEGDETFEVVIYEDGTDNRGGPGHDHHRGRRRVEHRHHQVG